MKRGRSPDPNDLLTPADAAAVLGVSADTVRNLSDAGKLPAMRTVSGRRFFLRSDVDAVLASRNDKARATDGKARTGDGKARTADGKARTADGKARTPDGKAR